jgi:hypothetical protein
LRYCRSRVLTFVFFMQKLTGISSGQNNKSCRIFHNGSNKIGFAFFCFFCDFLRNLQETGKWQTLLELPFCKKDPGKIFGFAMSSPGRGGRRGWPNSGSSPWVLAGEGREEGQGSLVSGFLAGVQVGAAPGVRHDGGPRRWTRQHRRR